MHKSALAGAASVYGPSVMYLACSVCFHAGLTCSCVMPPFITKP